MNLKIWIPIWIVAAIIGFMFGHIIHARDFGQWGNEDPTVRKWYQGLMQPDNPTVSCCGVADAYWADKIEVDGDKVYAIITDPRDDAVLARTHVPMGTKILIPPNKLKYDKGNPTGHNILFMRWYGPESGPGEEYIVYCFVQSSGV